MLVQRDNSETGPLCVWEIEERQKKTIGRSRRQCDFVLPTSKDQKLTVVTSRLHASLHTEDQLRAFIVDEKSANGTYVNNRKLLPEERFALCDGDIISFGGMDMVRVDGRSMHNPYVFIWKGAGLSAVVREALDSYTRNRVPMGPEVVSDAFLQHLQNTMNCAICLSCVVSPHVVTCGYKLA